MSLVGRVGRKRPRARIALGIVYAILIVGAVTTLYPFFVMAVTGFKGPTDQNDNKLIPAFWTDLASNESPGKLSEGSLLGKYLNDKYAGEISQIESTRIGASAPADEVARYEALLESLPPNYWSAGFRTAPNQVTGKLTLRYQAWLRERFRGDIDALNRAYIDESAAFQSVSPPTEMLERATWKVPTTRKYLDWLEFKRMLPAEFRIPVREERLFQEFLRRKFRNQFSAVPREVAGEAAKFEQVRLDPSRPLFREFRETDLKARFPQGTVEELWSHQSKGPLPIQAYEESYVSKNAGPLRTEFTTRNYRYVVDYMMLNGRAVANTFLFCLLAILTQLTVNPLAAYALSRYPLKASAKILLFLLATMAFPAEVAMIPSFLLLKDVGLLNTFSALVLPTAASGYMIFLLKGFFDSLPAEFYEAAQLDGARETTMMFRVTLPLARPVLGYLALLAFMGAYGAFMYAFLVCQDQRMWTIMVWIYQLQNVAPKSVMMAALTMAALPTLLVFLLAQRVILQGIVLPGEK